MYAHDFVIRYGRVLAAWCILLHRVYKQGKLRQSFALFSSTI